MADDGRMHRRAAASLVAALSALLSGQEPAAPADPKPAPQRPEPTDQKDRTPSDFARFVTDGAGGHLDVAVTTYRNADGVEVQLLGAVHIADGRFYAELERRFERCEALLYELVGPENYRPKKGDSRDGFISMLQNLLKGALELEFQLDGIDYSAANFVHADMTPAEFEKSMAERGETLLGLIWKMMFAGARYGAGTEVPAALQFDLAQAFRDGEGRHKLRLAMATQIEQIENVVAVAGNTTLLEGRNEKCLEVLRQQIAAGRKKLGIFYGAAHLPHMEQRLVGDLGFHKVDHEWLVAWDCAPRRDPKADRALWAARRKAKDEVARIAAAVREWRSERGGDAVPSVADLGSPRQAGGTPWYAGSPQDPWGHDYAIAGYARPPGFDVHCLGQDGVAGTDDDVHSATPRELRRMLRPAAPAEPPKPDPAETARKDLLAIFRAASRFREQHGRVPTVAELEEPGSDGGAVAYGGKDKDPWGGFYRLRLVDGRLLEALSDGPDGKLGTDDDVVIGGVPGQEGQEAREQLVRTKAEVDAKAIYNAAKLFKINNGRIPTMADLTTPDAKGKSYLASISRDPWDCDYVLRELERGRFEVRSAGPDGKLDTADDVVAPSPRPLPK
jgi:hypothetical protein